MIVPCGSHREKFIYWTGGYDSTFLVLDSLTNGNIVQPIYLEHCDARKNADLEIRAMNNIKNRLPIELSKRLLSTIYVDCRNIKLDDDIESGMWELYQTGKLRLPKSQYSYLAQIPRILKIRISAGSELGPGTSISQHVRPFVDKHGLLTKTAPWYLQIFSGVHFPVINVTKQQMLTTAIRKGFSDLLYLTWTCRVPVRIGNRIYPCQKCQLCRDRIVK